MFMCVLMYDYISTLIVIECSCGVLMYDYISSLIVI